MTSIFISYSRQELTFADNLYRDLSANGHNVFLDIHYLVPGQNWHQQLVEAIHDADSLVWIISVSSVASPIVCEEIALAQQLGKPIYLAIFEATKFDNSSSVDWMRIRSSSYIDFRRSYRAALKDLQLLLLNPSSASITVPPESGFRMPPVPRLYELTLVTSATLLMACVIILVFWGRQQIWQYYREGLQINYGQPYFGIFWWLQLPVFIPLMGLATFLTLQNWMNALRVRRRKYRFWHVILTKVVTSFVLIILLLLIGTVLPFLDKFERVTDWQQPWSFTGYYQSGINLVYETIMIFLPLLTLLYQCYLIGHHGMYRWSGTYGYHQTRFNNWRVKLLQPILNGLMICFAIGIGLGIPILTNSGVSELKLEVAHTLATLGIPMWGLHIFLRIAEIVTYFGLVAILPIYLGVFLLASRNNRKSRDRQNTPSRKTKALKIAIDYSPQDASIARFCLAILQQLHIIVDVSEADIILGIMSRNKKYRDSAYLRSNYLPIIVEGDIIELDDNVKSLQMIDWRKGFTRQNLKTLAVSLDQPAKLATLLDFFPRKLQNRHEYFPQVIQGFQLGVKGALLIVIGIGIWALISLAAQRPVPETVYASDPSYVEGTREDEIIAFGTRENRLCANYVLEGWTIAGMSGQWSPECSQFLAGTPYKMRVWSISVIAVLASIPLLIIAHRRISHRSSIAVLLTFLVLGIWIIAYWQTHFAVYFPLIVDFTILVLWTSDLGFKQYSRCILVQPIKRKEGG